VSHESLQRVLMKIKEAAREMRKGNLDARLKPQAEDPLAEGSPTEEAAEPDGEKLAELAGAEEGEAPAPLDEEKPVDDEEATKAAIRKLLARV
jgi:hypothetical protein